MVSLSFSKSIQISLSSKFNWNSLWRNWSGVVPGSKQLIVSIWYFRLLYRPLGMEKGKKEKWVGGKNSFKVSWIIRYIPEVPTKNMQISFFKHRDYRHCNCLFLKSFLTCWIGKIIMCWSFLQNIVYNSWNNDSLLAKTSTENDVQKYLFIDGIRRKCVSSYTYYWCLLALQVINHKSHQVIIYDICIPLIGQCSRAHLDQ